MKIVFFLSFVFIQVGFSQSLLQQEFDFVVEGKTMRETLQSLSEKIETDIAFSSNFFDNDLKNSFHFKNESLSIILSTILNKTNVSFKILDDRILLFLKKGPQLFTLSGYIKDKKSGERLIAATVYVAELQKGTVTNEYGFYSLTLPSGKTKLQVQFLGYQENAHTINLDKNLRCDIALETNLMLPEVIVSPFANETSAVYRAPNNILQINKNFVEASPGLGGEEDFVRTSQLLPGVEGGIDGLGGVQVRGGESGQNLMLMDGVPVYIPYHLLGVYSVYNSSTVNSTQLLKGSFSARYGGRLSSVYDVRIKEGNKEEWQAEAAVNLVNAKVLIEGPIDKGKGSILIAGRYAPDGFLLNPEFKRIYFQIEEEGELKSTFNDFNIKMNYSISSKDHIYLSMFSGSDAFSRFYSEFDDEYQMTWNSFLDFDWDNRIGMLRWNHLFNKKLFSNTTITYSAFSVNNTTFEEFESDNETDDLEFFENRSNNKDIGVKIDFDYIPNPTHSIRFGAALSDKTFVTSFVFFEEDDKELEDIEDIDLESIQELTTDHFFTPFEASVYAEDQINISNDWYASLGLRGSAYFNESKSYFNLEPRLMLRYQWSPKVSLFSSVSQMVQYLHLVTNAALRLPNDLWISSGKGVLPSKSLQGEFGISWQVNNKFSVNVDGYYKKMKNLLAYPDNLDYLDELDIEQPDSFLTRGQGKIYGAEFFFKYSTKKTEAGISYVHSKSSRQYKDQNLGLSYPHEYDQRHRFKLYFYQKIGKYFSLSTNWVYNSPNPQWGLANTDLTFDFENPEFNPPGQKNKLRSSPYFRIDCSLSFQRQGPKLGHRLKLGVYNLSNRQNTAFHNLYSPDNINSINEPVNGIPFLPSFSYRLKF